MIRSVCNAIKKITDDENISIASSQKWSIFMDMTLYVHCTVLYFLLCLAISVAQ
jgi:hypothetical protein